MRLIILVMLFNIVASANEADAKNKACMLAKNNPCSKRSSGKVKSCLKVWKKIEVIACSKAKK